MGVLLDKASTWIEEAGASWEPLERKQSAEAIHLLASRRAMACEFQVQYHASAGLNTTDAMIHALDIIDAVEDQLTVYRDHSEVMAINAHAGKGPVEVEDNLLALLQLSQKICQETGGAFDITSSSLSRSWGFLQRAGKIPSQSEIAIALSRVGPDRWLLDLEEKTILLTNPGVEINFNAIGKGYALDQASAWLSSQGIHNYLWHGGRSSVLACGQNQATPDLASNHMQPNLKGEKNDPIEPTGWTVGLPHPYRPGQRLAELHLHNCALATAGSNTQCIQHQGKRLGHILDPRTGWPADQVESATVITHSAAQADALATAFYIMGPEQTEKYCHDHPEVKALLVCPAKGESEVLIHTFGITPLDWTPGTGIRSQPT